MILWRAMLGVAVVGLLGALAGCAPTSTPSTDGDQSVDAAQYPYFVAVTGGSQICGGSVVARTWVLTAAHCVPDVLFERMYLTLSNGQFVKAEGVILHPRWDGLPHHGYDLALVRVPESATRGITPIQVGSAWDSSIYTPGTAVTRVGTGRYDHGTGPLLLRASAAVIQSDDEMAEVDHPRGDFARWPAHLLLGASPVTRAACHLDVGGPLVVIRQGRPIQVGVSSFSAVDCEQPAAFTELAGAQLAWVASVAGDTVVAGWGACTQPDGQPGESLAVYGDQPDGAADGPYRWSITCVGATRDS